MRDTSKTVLVWVGRFVEHSGYAAAARTYLDICRDAGIPVLAIDTSRCEVVGPACGVPVRVERGPDGSVTVHANDQDTRFVTVVHETPPFRERVDVSGRVRLVNYTVFETDALPQAWVDHALDFDEIWTASEFNVETFSSSGIPRFMLHKIPHALAPGLEHHDIEPMPLAGAKGFVFLSVLSAFNRKDAAGLVAAYNQAFTAEDDTTLLLKLKANAPDEMVEQYIWASNRASFDPDSEDAPHIMLVRTDFSDEQLWSLHRRADAYVSLERGKGWDIPAMEAMALGTPAVALSWGGITEFMNEDNALVIGKRDHLVTADRALVQNHTMYAAHRWSTYRPSEAVAAMRRIYDDAALRDKLRRVGPKSVREVCSGQRVARLIRERMDSLAPTDFRQTSTASITLAPKGRAARPVALPPRITGAGAVASVIKTSPPEVMFLMAMLREVREVPAWKPGKKLEKLEALMYHYHCAKHLLPPNDPVVQAIERFASVPRKNPLAKVKGYRELAGRERELLFAATLPQQGDPFEPFDPEKHNLDEWMADRRKLWSQAGGAVAPPAEERDRLRTLRNSGHGNKIVIMGNAPSLRKIDFDALRGVPTFAANRIYLAYDKTPWRPTYFTSLDWRVTPDNYHEINKLTGSTFLFPNRFRGLLREGEDVYWYHSINRTDRWREQFETDATHGVRGLGTVVTAMLQLAWHMGYRDFVLVGVDASYNIPDTVLQSGKAAFDTGNKLELTSTLDDDHNHFDPRYFGAGKKWHDPNVDEMVRCFAICRKAIEARGGRIVNATPGGKLEVFDRVNLDDELGVRTLRTEASAAQLIEPVMDIKPAEPLDSDPLLR